MTESSKQREKCISEILKGNIVMKYKLINTAVERNMNWYNKTNQGFLTIRLEIEEDCFYQKGRQQQFYYRYQSYRQQRMKAKCRTRKHPILRECIV
jgi:hypothetical protein